MKKYVALLRGVNAGASRRVPMSQLRQLFEETGFVHVSTYINSGNVVFESDTIPNADEIQSMLEKYFSFSIDILIIPADDIIRIAAAIPSDWKNDALNPEKTGQKSDVMYLFPDIDMPEIIDTFSRRDDSETIMYVPGALLSNVLRKNQSKSSLLKLVGTPLYRRMTVRNIQTAKKLAELVK